MASAPAEFSPDEYVGKLPSQVPPEILRRLSTLNPYIPVARIVLEWVMILGSISLAWRFWHPALYLLMLLWIGSRQHALGVLMHEGAHFRMFKNKVVNDWVSDIFLAWPILITTASYRANHSRHHRYTNTESDPDCHRKLFQMPAADWEFPTTWRRLAAIFLKDITAISSIYIVKSVILLGRTNKDTKTTEVKPGKDARPLAAALARVVFYLAILASAIAFGFWKQLLLFWFVPYLTTFNLLLHVRSIAEHFATANDHPLNITRTTLISGWEKIFFPYNINYHIEHHLYPSVPFYRLPALHAALRQQPDYVQHSHVTHGYLAVLRECVQLSGFKQTCLRADRSGSPSVRAHS
jgi:fatty acid desaturase